jgi:uncharacterized peroxidase-related enzyme
MTRIPPLSPDGADDEQRRLLADTQQRLGRVPNLYAAMAHSPAALRGYLGLRDALSGGALGAVERELLALLVAQDNDCEYCVSAHTFRGGRMRISDEDLLRARQADSPDPHTRAVLRLARSVLARRGRVADAELAEARAAGVTDAEVLEVVAHVALNALSNYVNHVARPPLDFPRVSTATDGAAA